MATTTRGIDGNISNFGSGIMSELGEIKSYLKQIEKELGDIDQILKKSIIREIEEHLNDKIDKTKSMNNGKVPEGEIKKILLEFGKPQEIAKEYQLQLSEEIQPSRNIDKSTMKRIVLPLIIFVIVALLILSYLRLPVEDEDNDIIYEGKGLDSIQIGDDLDKIIDQFGEPEDRVDSDNSIWLSYRENEGIDFVLSNQTERIIEIRFNLGFSGSLSNGISIGSNLDDVLNNSGGANIRVQTNYSEAQDLTYGIDKVLYEQTIDGDITAYKFIDAKKGILYWFDSNQKITQIVVFNPS